MTHRPTVQLAAVVMISLCLGHLAAACDLCHSPHGQGCACQPRGLLDALDSAAKRLHPCITRFELPRLQSIDLGLSLQRRSAHRASCGCESVPSCGCESHPSGGGIAGPTCGCEVAPSCGCQTVPSCTCQTPPSCGCEIEASCGCESSGPNCGCELNRSHGSGATPRYVPSPPPTQMQAAPREFYPAPRAREFESYPAGPQELPSAPVPLQQMPSAPTRPLQPAPLHELREEVQPLPDAQIDPFRVDSANRVRRIPVRSIQHSQSQENYRRNYDPQATNGARLNFSDHSTSPEGSAAVEGSSRTLARESSSRNRWRSAAPATAEATAVEAIPDTAPSVISASGVRPQRLPSLREIQAVNSTNPLRSH